MIATIDPIVWDFWRTIVIAFGGVLVGFTLLVTLLYWTRRKTEKAHIHVYVIALSYALAFFVLIADQATRFGGGLTWRLPCILLAEILGAFALRNLWKRHQLSRRFNPEEEE